MTSSVFFSQGNLDKKAGEFLPNFEDNAFYDEINLKVLDDLQMKFISELDPKEMRIYSRRVLWMFEALFQLKIRERLSNFDPYRVGIYVAGRGNVTPWNVLRARQIEGLSIYKAMKFNYFPKHGLKYNLGIAPAHLSIFFDIKGPTNAFINSIYSPLHAIERANTDLKLKNVDLAIVACVNIFEEPFHVVASQTGSRTLRGEKNVNLDLAEGVFCCLLEAPLEATPNIQLLQNENEKGAYLGILEGLCNSHGNWWHV